MIPALLSTVVLLLVSALVIYFACELFVNGVEWLGRKLAVGQTATGTVLAAFGTALPETVVTLVAVAFGATAAQKAIGVGAALGGPLALATVAYAVVGLMLLLTGARLETGPEDRAASRRLSRDQGWFLLIFAVKIGLGLITFVWKPWLGLVFLAAYGLYVRGEIRRGPVAGEDEEALTPLTFARGHAEPPEWRVLVQTGGALLVIFAASRVFVSQLEALGPVLGFPPQLLALLLSPLATELPETLNAVIWVKQGKHRLALANISGSMMIQATVPTAFGLFYTPWRLDPPLILASAVTLGGVGALCFAFRRGAVSRSMLAAMGLFYLAFVLLLFGLRL